MMSPSCRHLLYTSSEHDEQNDETDDHKTNLFSADTVSLLTNHKSGSEATVTARGTDVEHKTWSLTAQGLKVTAAKILHWC